MPTQLHTWGDLQKRKKFVVRRSATAQRQAITATVVSISPLNIFIKK